MNITAFLSFPTSTLWPDSSLRVMSGTVSPTLSCRLEIGFSSVLAFLLAAPSLLPLVASASLLSLLSTSASSSSLATARFFVAFAAGPFFSLSESLTAGVEACRAATRLETRRSPVGWAASDAFLAMLSDVCSKDCSTSEHVVGVVEGEATHFRPLASPHVEFKLPFRNAAIVVPVQSD
ncbi:hypothetical protein BCV69DRAFT_96483 [Microstroma glucosiphilum]|uniref:Uncharacterized protein n=1 Tax=Pseudomicrostroma glucosiphilum TaxID=1684307 RepID=A0A316UFS2_9BASI|nr:hypothetical protein BCV69DRAFT_96483 [Pseudomicrostroma glucosiphilum]PWN22753.1 hypothetical protein BCV69DRAFT_96483 [Pseudomicrostroma glucosiphilum]